MVGAVAASLTLLASAASAPGAPLHYSFEVARATGAIYNPWTLSNDKVELRSFIGHGDCPLRQHKARVGGGVKRSLGSGRLAVPENVFMLGIIERRITE